MSARVERPIIILGAGRSGTTALTEVLRHHPDVAVWEEPKHIWRFGHAYRSHDVLTAADATPRVKRYIHEQFAAYLRDSGKARFIEKTPSNCFRVSFIRAVFPDALFVHVMRDGRAAVTSAMEQWRHDFVGSFDTQYVPNTSYQKDAQRSGRVAGLFNGWKTTLKFIREKRRLAGGPAVWLEAPAYVPDLARVYLRKMSSADRAFVWGPKFPGISTVLERQGLLDAAAIQWLLCEQYVSADLAGLGSDRVYPLRYEDLVRAPGRIVGGLAEFAGLTDNAPLVAAADRMLSPRPERWRDNLSDADVLRLEAWLRPVLERYGYLDAGGAHA